MSAASRPRTYEGHPFLSFGFRPLFLLASLQAGLAILIWLPFISGRLDVPTAFSPVDWHVHEMLFGYQAAAIGGFLLTAIPNWTGRLPVQGIPLLVLALAWIAGRFAVSVSALVGWQIAMVIDCLFLALLAGAAIREIVAGRNWRNLKVVGVLCLLTLTNVAFHLEAHLAGEALYARRLAIAAILSLVALIGGRIIPSFTNNWLASRGGGRLPVPFAGYDKLVLILTASSLALWVAVPEGMASGVALSLCAALHLVRLGRWAGERTWRNPLLVILHIAYLFVPVGFGLTAAASFGLIPAGAGLHAWTAGAFGTLTLAVMSRASLGHTGRSLNATLATKVSYLLVLVGSIARIISALDAGWPVLLDAAGLCWSLGFILFSVAYWPVFTGPRIGQKTPSIAVQR